MLIDTEEIVMNEETMNEETINNTDAFEGSVELPQLTPYEASKVANIVLENAGGDRRVKPQMLYGYAKSNRIESNYKTRGEDEKVLFNGESFKKWLDAYVAGNIESGTRKDYNELAGLFQ